MALPLASVQLYSLASEFSADMHGSLERLAAIGFTTVEAFDFVGRPAEIRAAFDATGITASTGHAPLLSDELWTPDGAIPTPAPEVVFEAAAAIGMTTVFDPFVDPARWLTEDGIADIAERLNRAADVAATFGLSVGYHNHAQEFVASFGGQTAYERFIELTEDRVQIELDLFWAQTGGQDVTALATRLGDELNEGSNSAYCCAVRSIRASPIAASSLSRCAGPGSGVSPRCRSACAAITWPRRRQCARRRRPACCSRQPGGERVIRRP